MKLDKTRLPARRSGGQPYSTLKTFKLPNELEGELNLPRFGGKSRDRTWSVRCSVGAKEQSVAVPAARLGWDKVVMIGDIEHLRPELNVENFRDTLDREVLQDRKVQVEESRPVDAIAAAVA